MFGSEKQSVGLGGWGDYGRFGWRVCVCKVVGEHSGVLVEQIALNANLYVSSQHDMISLSSSNLHLELSSLGKNRVTAKRTWEEDYSRRTWP